MFELSKVFLIVAILVASFIEFWSAIALCIKKDDGQLSTYNTDCEEEWAWAVFAGLFGCVTCIVLLVLNKFKAELLDGVVGWICYFLLFANWFITVAVCTMKLPFAPQGNFVTVGHTYGDAGNGYFACWMAFTFATILFFSFVTPLANICTKVFGNLDETKKMLFLILAASGLEMWHAARICDDSTHCVKMLAWAVSAGAMSTILIAIFLVLLNFVAAVANFTKFFAAFLAMWWLAAVCTLTMYNGNSSSDCDSDDPYCVGVFLAASNGFFGTWVAMIGSVILTAQQFGVEVPGFTQQEGGPTGAKAEGGALATKADEPTAPGHEHTHEEPKSATPAEVDGTRA